MNFDEKMAVVEELFEPYHRMESLRLVVVSEDNINKLAQLLKGTISYRFGDGEPTLYWGGESGLDHKAELGKGVQFLRISAGDLDVSVQTRNDFNNERYLAANNGWFVKLEKDGEQVK